MPEVSIIIPVYNTSKYLPRCIESILAQTLTDFEAIFVDDGSTDQSLDILRQHAKKDKRLKVLSQKNLFAGVARNKGLKAAKGKYLYFMDSDDWLEPNALFELTKAANQTNADIITFNCKYVMGGGKTKIKTDAHIKNPFHLKPSVWVKFFKTSFIKGHNILFDTVQAANDILFTYHAAVKAKKIVYLNKCLYNYRANASGALSRTRNKHTDCIFQTLNNLKQILIKENLFETYEKSFIERAKIFLKAELKKTDQRPVISLTSFPARIKIVDQTIKTLLAQTFKPEKVVLWLSPEEFPHQEKDLPQALLALKEKGLEIGWTANLRSYKKLIPSLKAFPASPVVTADDDVLYPNDWLKSLWETYLKYPECIIAHRIHQFKFSNGKKPAPYNNWKQKIFCSAPLYQNFLTGVGGVLYPPHSLHADVLKENLFMKLCPKQDDIWFWAMALLNRTKIKQTLHAVPDPLEIKDSQTIALNKENCGENLNDKALIAVFEKYKELPLLLQKEKKPLSCKLRNVLRHILFIRRGGVRKSGRRRIIIELFGIRFSL